MSLLITLLSLALLGSPQNAFGGALPPWLVERAAALGYVSPTPVQAEAIDVVLSGRDAIIQAKTGSGKTLAYMLPLLAGLKPQSSVQALVLLPTRELASQVAIVARRLAAGSPDRLLVMALLDGSGAKRQRKWLVAQPPQVVVGNVQQVDSVIQARPLRLETLKLLVVDEVDACLSDGATSVMLQNLLGGKLAIPAGAGAGAAAAAPTVPAAADSRVARAASFGSLAERQTLFVSASLPQRNVFRKQVVQQRWCRETPVLVHAEPLEAVPAQLRHGWAPCAASKRLAALRLLLRRHAPALQAAIVFAPPTLPLERIAEALAGVLDEAPPAILAEGQPLNARAAAVRELKERRKRLLLSTPLGARGLDVAHCSHVYLLGVPDSAEDYLHAAGRCGRMGQPGLVTVLCGEKEAFALGRIGNALGIEFLDAREADPE